MNIVKRTETKKIVLYAEKNLWQLKKIIYVVLSLVRGNILNCTPIKLVLYAVKFFTT